MIKKNIKFKYIILIIFALLLSAISYIYHNPTLLNEDTKKFIRQYIKKKTLSESEKNYKVLNTLISKQYENINSDLLNAQIGDDNKNLNFKNEEIFKQKKLIEKIALDLDLSYKKNLFDIQITSFSKKKIFNNLLLKKSKIDGLNSGMYHSYPGTAYLEKYENNLLMVSSRGVIAFKDLEKEENFFKQIPNNLSNFISRKQFEKNKYFSIKGIHINKTNIFISFSDEVEIDCWNTSLLQGKMNFSFIEFKKIFSPDECIHEKNNVDKEFHPAQSGGAISSINQDELILGTGDYRSRSLAQKEDSINGKVLKINTSTSNVSIISKGHRNIQGAVYLKKKNILITTEHGPAGGDEINLINLNKKNTDIPNYGWPISSYGEHYGKKESNKMKYLKYPLYKSHNKYGFVEPIKYFTPSIGISRVIQINENILCFASLKDASIYFLILNEQNQINQVSRTNIDHERIRDIVFLNNKLYLFLETSASIGEIDINLEKIYNFKWDKTK